jgi:hypothetical protein
MDKIFIAKILLWTSLVLGTGAAVYKFYPSTQEKAISQMIENFSDIKTFEYEGGVKMNTSMGNISSTFTGASDISDINDLKSSLVLDMVTNMLGQNMNMNLETRNIEKISYVKINKAPNLGFVDLSKFTNQWIKLDTNSLTKQISNTSLATSTTKTLTDNQIAKLKNLIANSDVFEITEKLSDEEIHGVVSNHYKFEINKEELKTLAIKANEIVSERQFTAEESEVLGKSFETIGEQSSEIWIGKSDSLPRKITMNIQMNNVNSVQMSGDMNISLTFKSFDEEINIETPANSKELDMNSLLSGKFLLK